MKEKNNNLISINKKKKIEQFAKLKIREYLKPECEEELAKEDYPKIKKD